MWWWMTKLPRWCSRSTRSWSRRSRNDHRGRFKRCCCIKHQVKSQSFLGSGKNSGCLCVCVFQMKVVVCSFVLPYIGTSCASLFKNTNISSVKYVQMWKDNRSSLKPVQAYRHQRGEKPKIGPNKCLI